MYILCIVCVLPRFSLEKGFFALPHPLTLLNAVNVELNLKLAFVAFHLAFNKRVDVTVEHGNENFFCFLF
ncbi:hypothetical protein T11_5335 [Trichinella zimbabwensis]|uniref:Uncharacterized protein n=1 Tax=Trichinella zimbabwensis TaxID=268475 RepID=A0A0V1H427_9BILA|nr:hypothetical protein T11_5335 [Trichinella zimbabwensis]